VRRLRVRKAVKMRLYKKINKKERAKYKFYKKKRSLKKMKLLQTKYKIRKI
jgi:hypothetical protein